MTKPEVIATMGKPDSISTQGRTEYLEYGWDKFADGIVGASEWYYVRLLNGKVESYGKKGDFDSTKNPTLDINVDQKITTDLKKTQPVESLEKGDLFTKLKKPQSLKEEGLLNEEEYQRLRKKAVEEAR